jgi:hypothetical protein
MSWTVACFCGTVFDAPADHCPTCQTPVPAVTRGVSAPMPLPDAVEALLRQEKSSNGSSISSPSRNRSRSAGRRPG